MWNCLGCKRCGILYGCVEDAKLENRDLCLLACVLLQDQVEAFNRTGEYDGFKTHHLQPWQAQQPCFFSTQYPAFFSSQEPTIPASSLDHSHLQPQTAGIFRTDKNSTPNSPYLQLSDLEGVTSMMLGAADTRCDTHSSLTLAGNISSLPEELGMKTAFSQAHAFHHAEQGRTGGFGSEVSPALYQQQACPPALSRHSMPVDCAKQRAGATENRADSGPSSLHGRSSSAGSWK